MIDGYKKAMDKIKADPEYKAQLIKNLENCNTEKTVSKKPARLLRIVTCAASVAACVLVVYCVSIFFAHPPKMLRPKPRNEHRSTANVMYFNFDGFDRYNIDIDSKAILVSNNIEDGYTLTNLISDYYTIIADNDSDILINDGMVDSFCGVDASNDREINIYVNDREIMNLNNELASECFEEYYVYFTVSITE